MVGRVHQERQRHLERVVDLGFVDAQFEARLDARQRRQDAKTEAGRIQIEIADRIDESAPQADFFLGFAQRGIERRGIGCIDLAAWVSSTVGSAWSTIGISTAAGRIGRSCAMICSMRSLPGSPLIGMMLASSRPGGISKRSRARARSKNSAEPMSAGRESVFSIGSFNALPSPAPHPPSRRIRRRT
jgi:hypothetical protein